MLVNWRYLKTTAMLKHIPITPPPLISNNQVFAGYSFHFVRNIMFIKTRFTYMLILEDSVPNVCSLKKIWTQFSIHLLHRLCSMKSCLWFFNHLDPFLTLRLTQVKVIILYIFSYLKVSFLLVLHIVFNYCTTLSHFTPPRNGLKIVTSEKSQDNEPIDQHAIYFLYIVVWKKINPTLKMSVNIHFFGRKRSVFKERTDTETVNSLGNLFSLQNLSCVWLQQV